MLNLKKDIMQHLKDAKTQRQRLVSKTTLEDKLDAEFLDVLMQRYAFFTSSINLSLQSDSDATKLSILLPMIDKHMQELKKD